MSWVKLHRKIWSNRYLRTHHSDCVVFLWLICNAHHRPALEHGVQLHRGDLLLNQSALAKEVDMPRSTLRRILKRLKHRQMITCGQKVDQKCATPFVLVSIVNYETYQIKKSEVRQKCATFAPGARRKSLRHKENGAHKKENYSSTKSSKNGAPPSRGERAAPVLEENEKPAALPPDTSTPEEREQERLELDQKRKRWGL